MPWPTGNAGVGCEQLTDPGQQDMKQVVQFRMGEGDVGHDLQAFLARASE
jgi:hypothetical protein